MESRIKNRVLPITLVLIIGLLAAGYWLFKGGPRSIVCGYAQDLQMDYDQFEIGTPRDRVLDKLGSPLWSKHTFCLPSGHEGYEQSLARANESKAVTYDVWINGINWYYCLGFDENGLLVVKAEGHD